LFVVRIGNFWRKVAFLRRIVDFEFIVDFELRRIVDFEFRQPRHARLLDRVCLG